MVTNNKIHSKLKARLRSEQQRLLQELAQLQTDTHPSEPRREGSPFGKREEEASESFELEKRLALEKQLQELLSEVEQALNKFEKGTYGLCDVCGQPIDPARLEAIPHANLCVRDKVKGARSRPIAG